MRKKITTYLCNDLIAAKQIRPSTGPLDGIEVSGDLLNALVTAKLFSSSPVPGCQSGAGKVIMRMDGGKAGSASYAQGGEISWNRCFTLDITGEYDAEHFLRTRFTTAAHCHAVQTSVWLQGLLEELFAYVNTPANEGPIPEGKDEVFCGGGEKKEVLSLERFVVPGEILALYYSIKNRNQCASYLVASTPFRTPCLTGGQVKEVINAYGDPAVKYRVDIEGTDVICVPSDFAEYPVGAWVFVAEISAGCDCMSCDRPPGYGAVSGYDYGEGLDANDLLSLINATRTANGLGVLSINSALTSAAVRHVRDMAVHDNYGHTGTDGSNPRDRMVDAGYCEDGDSSWTGENCYQGPETVQAAFDGWMLSAGHRANILRPEFKEMGVAIFRHEGGVLFWCNDFGYNPAHDDTAQEADPDYIIMPFAINGKGPAI